MAFWDNISKKATEATSKTVQKTKDLSEINRLNGLISEEEENLNVIYNKIGILYYSLHGNDKEYEFLDMMSSVKGSNDRIEGYRKQIRDIKGITCCPECGEEVSKDARFCSSCGAKLTAQDAESEETVNTEHTCPGCGSPLPEGAKFCSVCGAEAPDFSETSETQQTQEE